MTLLLSQCQARGKWNFQSGFNHYAKGFAIMTTLNSNPALTAPQFTTLHTNWKAALKAANSFSGRDAHAYRMDAQVDDRAAILLETPALNLSDIAKKFAILEHYICIGGDHGNGVVSHAFEQIKLDLGRMSP